MLTLSPNSFHWRIQHENRRKGNVVLKKACEILNALTPEQKAAVGLYASSEKMEGYDEGYSEGEGDGSNCAGN